MGRLAHLLLRYRPPSFSPTSLTGTCRPILPETIEHRHGLQPDLLASHRRPTKVHPLARHSPYLIQPLHYEGAGPRTTGLRRQRLIHASH